MITRPATIGTSSAHEVSAISAAIPNPSVSAPSVTINHRNAPVPSASRPSAANISRHPAMPTPAIPRGSCTNGMDPRTEYPINGTTAAATISVASRSLMVSLRIIPTSFLDPHYPAAANLALEPELPPYSEGNHCPDNREKEGTYHLSSEMRKLREDSAESV